MTALQGAKHSPRRGWHARGICAVAALAAAMVTAAATAGAEVRIGGNPQAIHLQLQNASIEDVLAALGRAFPVRYRSATKLEKQLSGTYQGSLPNVVTRLLDGYSFVVKSTGGGVEVTILGTRSGTAPPASATWKREPAPPLAKKDPAPVPSAVVPGPIPVFKLADGSTPPMPLPSQGEGRLSVPEPQPATIEPPLPLPARVAPPEPGGSTVPPPTPAETNANDAPRSIP